MIQRIQSVYLVLAIICLSIVSFGAKIVSFSNSESRFDIYSYGIDRRNISSGMIEENLQYFPGYLVGIGLILLGTICLFLFKKLKFQMKVGRMFFYTYLAAIISVLVMIYLGQDHMTTPVDKRSLGLGFLFLVIGFPFTFLANTGIKRDKKLMDSLDRLR